MTDRFHLFETAHGTAAIAWHGDVVTGFRLPAATVAEAERSARRRWPNAKPDQPPPAIEQVIAATRRYFAGEPVDFAPVAIDLGAQDALFARIYDRVRALPRGETTTYGAIAKALELGPEFARDVGQAMARNPIPLIVPCHRVLAAGGKVGGFSAPGGSDAKARMLALEGVSLASPPPPDRAQASFGF